jgi:hypothetical protein
MTKGNDGGGASSRRRRRVPGLKSNPSQFAKEGRVKFTDVRTAVIQGNFE